MKSILYIAGSSHCGSTILDIILGAGGGAQSLGQAADLHKNETCSCGKTLTECPIWGPVVTDPRMPDAASLRNAGQLIRREKGLPKLMVSHKQCAEYAHLHDRIFELLFDTTGEDTLIDSSKNFARAVALTRASRYEIRTLHLVRDPRGFINSTNKRRSERNKANAYLRPTAEWLIKNSIGSVVLNHLAGERYKKIHYESLLTRPAETLREIGEFANIDVAPVIERIRNNRPFERRHIFAGNRISTRDSITFDPSRIAGQRLEGLDNAIYWFSLGWVSSPWGYRRRQRYLE